MEKKIRVKYNGRRFPKIVQIRGGVNKSFQPGREKLVLDEYDALLLLKSNVRLAADKWAMTVVSSISKDAKEEIARETKLLNVKIEELEKELEDLKSSQVDDEPEPEEIPDPEPEKKEKDNKAASGKKTKKAMKK